MHNPNDQCVQLLYAHQDKNKDTLRMLIFTVHSKKHFVFLFLCMSHILKDKAMHIMFFLSEFLFLLLLSE